MTPDRIQRAFELFEQALQRPLEERAAYLTEASGDDAELRADVESLLEHDRQAGEDFLQPVGQTRTREVPVKSAASQPAVQIEGYEIIRELGRGGQAVVYQAIQKTTKRKVAIKVLLEGPYASRTAQKRFEREIELVAQLRHPNIIGIFHSGTTPDGRQFYVMDYVRGMPLQHYVREKKLTLEETLKLFATVCEAVQHAHQKGMIHRDLKPTNILVDADGSPKVMDFGLAKLLAGPIETLVSISQELVGTLPFMSPEQARGNPDEIDTRTDIYALGVILYELLTGQYPYPVVGQIVEVLKHITDTPPTPPSRQWKPDSGVAKRSSKKLRAGQCPIDDEVQTIVLRSLAKERERRYQSAGELARDIEHYLVGDPIEAKRDSGLYVLKKALRRYRVPVAITGFLLAAVAITTGVWRESRARAASAEFKRRIALIESDWDLHSKEVPAFYNAFLSQLRPGSDVPEEISVYLANAVDVKLRARRICALDTPWFLISEVMPKVELAVHGISLTVSVEYSLGDRKIGTFGHGVGEAGSRNIVRVDASDKLAAIRPPCERELNSVVATSFRWADRAVADRQRSSDAEVIATHTFTDRKRVLILETLPADYPTRISDQSIVDLVKETFIIEYVKVDSEGYTLIAFVPRSPVNIAGQVVLLDPASGNVVARGAVDFPLMPSADVSVEQGRSYEWDVDALSAAVAGTLDSVRVRIEPNRNAALSVPGLEEYLDVPLEYTVPLKRGTWK